MSDTHQDIDIAAKEELEAKAKALFSEPPYKSRKSATGRDAWNNQLVSHPALSALLSTSNKRFAPRTVATAKDLGEAVRLRRKDLGLTQRELAERSGTGERFVSEVEHGKETAEIGKVMDLLDVLGLETRITVQG